MKSKLIFALLILLLGCDIFPYDNFRYSPDGLSATMLVSYELISHSPTEVVYEIKLASFNYYNDLYYDASSYNFTGPGDFKVLQIEGVEANTNAASSNVVLLDQSGSYAEIDPHNLRTKITNKFLEDFEATDNFILGAFSSNGLLTDQPVAYASTNFNSEWTSQEFLFSLPKLTGGNCSLYDALNSAIDKLSLRSENNKNIIVLTHSNDAASSVSINDLTSKAIANSIKITVVSLGPDPTPSILWGLNDQTHGMASNCPQDLHLVTILNHLYRLMNGPVYLSRLRIQFKPNSGNVASGDWFENQIKIIDSFSGYEFNPVFIEIKIP